MQVFNCRHALFKNKISIPLSINLTGRKRGGGSEPTATGRLCEWKEDPSEPSSKFKSFGGYQRSLTLECQEGQPGIIQWTPDDNTPDLVYYQCYTHRSVLVRNKVSSTKHTIDNVLNKSSF